MNGTKPGGSLTIADHSGRFTTRAPWRAKLRKKGLSRSKWASRHAAWNRSVDAVPGARGRWRAIGLIRGLLGS